MELVDLAASFSLNKICRLCMGKGLDYVPLFEQDDNISEKVSAIVPMLKLSENDGLPGQICSSCLNQVNTSYSFKLQCESSDVTLRQLLDFQHGQYQNENSRDTLIKEESENIDTSSVAGDNDMDDDFESYCVKPEAGPADPPVNSKREVSLTEDLVIQQENKTRKIRNIPKKRNEWSWSKRSRVYKRKQNTRGQWTQENLAEAARRYIAGEIGLREAERLYGVPARTLGRRIASGKLIKRGLGPEGVLGYENEKRLVSIIQRLASSGFSPDRPMVRQLAYYFAEKHRIKHSFSHVKQMAGYDWLASFLERNPELSTRETERLVLRRSPDMYQTEIETFFKLLEQILREENLMNSPKNIFNVDEIDFQLINNHGEIVVEKGTKDINPLTSIEREETITLIACNNAKGEFLPPVLIMKGMFIKKDILECLPHGSDVYRNDKSYVDTELIVKWFKEHFLLHKPPGETLLLMDGHPCHYNAFEMFNLADVNGVTILCLPRHKKETLQPLDKTFFEPLETFYNQKAKDWMDDHEDRCITMHLAACLIGEAWRKVATVDNALSGLKATGIFPLNPSVITEDFYSSSDDISAPSGSDILGP